MSKKPDFEPFFIAIQNEYTPIPSNFRYRCLCWIGKPRNFFCQRPEREFELIAVGTEEGPIVVLGEDGDVIVEVALLCGHHAAVSSITKLIMQDLFLSVSTNGTICSWSALDGTCVMKYVSASPPGDLRLCPSYIDPFTVFIWAKGGTLHKFDMNSQKYTYSLPSVGTISCSPLFDDGIVHVTINCMSHISKETLQVTKKELYDYKISNCVFASPNAIVSCEHGHIALYNVDTLEIMSSFDIDIPRYDNICDIVWKNDHVFYICTIGGLLFEVLNASPGPAQRVGTATVTNFSYNNNGKLVFLMNMNNIKVILENGKHLVFSPKQRAGVNYIPKAGKFKGLVSVNSCECQYYKNGSLYMSFMHTSSLVSAIFSTKLRSGKYFILGGNDGSICVYSKDNSVPFLHFYSVPSAIVGFCQTPFSYNGSPRILAIGADGSLCLFNLSDFRLFYIGIPFQINYIYTITSHSLLIVSIADGRYLFFNLEDSNSILETSYLPENAELIWSKAAKVIASAPVSTGCVSIGNQSITFTSFDISVIKPESINETETSEIKSLISLVANSKGNATFALIGASQTPTFVYPPFSISGQKTYSSSPFIAATHWIACSVIGRTLGIPTQFIGFVNNESMSLCMPIILRNLFVSSQEIQKVCSSFCLGQFHLMTPQKCIEMTSLLISTKNVQKLPNHDKMLMAMAVTVQSKIIPPEHHQVLYGSLVAFAGSGFEYRHVALMLLTIGFSTWISCVSAFDLYTFQIRQLFKINSSAYPGLIARAATEDFKTFLVAFNNVFCEIAKEGVEPNITMLLSLLSNSSFHKTKIGPYGTLQMAKLMVKYPNYASQIKEHIQMHQNMFKAIRYIDDYLMIGLPDGFIHVFIKDKPEFDMKALNSSIDIVSPSPNLEFLTIVSLSTGEWIQLSMVKKTGIFGIEKSRIVSSGTVHGVGTECLVEWYSNTQCNVLMYSV